MHLRLISWFFIILNFMEYIGSQNASRGRRQRRSKCRVFYAFAPSRRVHLSGRFASPESAPSAAVFPPCTPRLRRREQFRLRYYRRLTLSSRSPALTPHRIHADARVRRTRR